MSWDKCFTRSEKGFSLVELMIVVGIIGLLATLAVPRFQQFQAKARMAEGKNLLNHIFTLEESYHLDNNEYVAMDTYGRQANGTLACDRSSNTGAMALGFELSPCAGPVPRFGYSVVAPANNEFTATATTGTGANNLICPGMTTPLTYTLNQARLLASPGRSTPYGACQ